MKTLYLECGMGAAGDMLTAALLELTKDRQAFLEKMNALGIPGVVIAAEKSVKCGITGTHMRVTVNGTEEEGHDHDHHHDGGHHHHDHHHSSVTDIDELIDLYEQHKMEVDGNAEIKAMFSRRKQELRVITF